MDDSILLAVDVLSIVISTILTFYLLFYSFKIAKRLKGVVGKGVKIFGVGLFFMMFINLYILCLPYILQLLKIEVLSIDMLPTLNFGFTIIMITLGIISIDRGQRQLAVFGGKIQKALHLAYYAGILLLLAALFYLWLTNVPTQGTIFIVLRLSIKIIRIISLQLGFILSFLAFRNVYQGIND